MSRAGKAPRWAVEVDGREYLWSISREGGYMWIEVAARDGEGRRLVVGVVADDMHVPVPGGGARTTQRKSVTPHLVRRIITEAIRLGWKPLQKNAREIRCRLVGDELIREGRL